MFGCYRKGDANDPDTYVAAVTAVLARYPEDIIMRVTHPVTGLPSRQNFLPTVKEVTDECDALFVRQQGHLERQRRIEKQLAEREQFSIQPTDEQREQIRQMHREFKQQIA